MVLVRGAAGVGPAVHGQVVGVVGDAAVGVHAAVVLGAGVLLRDVARVAVLHRVAHVPEARRRVTGRADDVLADQEVGLRGRVEVVLGGVELDRVAHHVAERLVERPGLVLVDEAGGVLRDAVRELVAVHVETARQRLAGGAVAVAVGHVGPVPEGVAVALAVVDDGDDLHPLVVDAVAAERVAVEVVHHVGVVVRVDARGLAGAGHARQVPHVVGVGHRLDLQRRRAAGVHRVVRRLAVVLGQQPVVAGGGLAWCRRSWCRP